MLPTDLFGLGYGVLVAIAFILAAASGRSVLTISAIIMIVSWWVSNLVVNTLGFAAYPYVIPEVDGALALVMVWALKQSFDRWIAATVALFVTEEVLHVVFICTNSTGNIAYNALLNGVFVAQCFCVGGSAIVALSMAGRSARGRRRFGNPGLVRRRSL